MTAANSWSRAARILEQVGFPAIATTSAGIAWSCGFPDCGAVGGNLEDARTGGLFGIDEARRPPRVRPGRAGRELFDAGTHTFLDGAITHADLQRRFGR